MTARRADRGHAVPLSLPRRWIADLTHASRNVPMVSFERRMNVSALAAARRRLADPPGWCALFVRAFALMAETRPEFRRCYLPLPRARLYEFPCCVAAVTVERDYRGESAVFFGLIRDPARRDIADIEQRIRALASEPIETNDHYRRLIRLARLPRFLRRASWSIMLHWSGAAAARNAGTFGISPTATLGATGLNLVSPLPFTLNYTAVSDAGEMDVRLHFDHRVTDGAPVARGLVHLEALLNTELAAELDRIGASDPRCRGRVGV